MNNIARLWIGFASVLSVVLVAMGWLSATAVRLDRAESAARQRAAVEENVRLALWRMDSALAPLLAQEGAHPHYLDETLSLALPSETHAGSSTAATLPVSGSSLNPCVLLRFQYPADAASAWLPELEQAGEPLEPLANRVPREHLLARLPTPRQWSLDLVPRFAGAAAQQIANAALEHPARSRATVEFQQRSQSLIMNNALVQQLQTQQFPHQSLAGSDTAAVMMTPLWISGEMVLARRVQHGNEEYLQGCLIDWPAMRRWLQEMVRDLLPDAHLEPLEEFDAAGETGLMAALPVRVSPGASAMPSIESASAMPQLLALAWAAVLLASLVGAALVAGVVRLSQRRGAFASAVTHELRTPLTTFRMYTEMLAQGMVQDAAAQREYLHTLRDQSLRLSHLVENVLAYARLERGRTLGPPTETAVAELIDPLLPSLERHVAAEQMELVVERTEGFDTTVLANRSAVEQILINLVDNACKYAGGATDRRVCLSAVRDGRFVAFKVRDHGPGLPARRSWFRPFGKTVQEAAHSAPGVGLGLALSRRLAEQMGGRLDVDRMVTDGAVLVLRLRLVPSAPASGHGQRRSVGSKDHSAHASSAADVRYGS